MAETTVAIVGAGGGGVYLAAHLGLLGCRLRLHDINDARLADIRARGGIDVEAAAGYSGGFSAVELATPELAPAIDGANIIVLCTGGNHQANAVSRMVTLLRDGQIILLIQGNTGGSLLVRRALDAAGC